MQRLVSNVRNTADERYVHLYFENNGVVSTEEYNCTGDYRNEIENEILLEQLKKLPKEKRIEAVKKVWQEAAFDLNFDGEDLHNLCKIVNVSVLDVLRDEIEAELKAEKTKSGHKQLFFVV